MLIEFEISLRVCEFFQQFLILFIIDILQILLRFCLFLGLIPLLQLSIIIVKSMLCFLFAVLGAVGEESLHRTHPFLSLQIVLLTAKNFRCLELFFQSLLLGLLGLKVSHFYFFMLLHVKRGLLFVVLQVIHLFLLFFAPFLNNILQQILLNILVILLLGCTVVLRGYENTLSIAGLIHTSVGRSTGRCWLFEATLQRNSTRKKGFSRALRHDIFNKVLTTYS